MLFTNTGGLVVEVFAWHGGDPGFIVLKQSESWHTHMNNVESGVSLTHSHLKAKQFDWCGILLFLFQLREAQNQIEELTNQNKHLNKRMEKIKQTRSALGVQWEVGGAEWGRTLNTCAWSTHCL